MHLEEPDIGHIYQNLQAPCPWNGIFNQLMKSLLDPDSQEAKRCQSFDGPFSKTLNFTSKMIYAFI